MSVFVKICGLTAATDVADAVAAGADALGFVFAESPRRITPKQAADIAAQVPAGVLKVAVMLHPTQSEWDNVEKHFQPDVLQSDADDFTRLDVASEQRRWPVYRQGVSDIAQPASDEYVYEGRASGKGQPVDWEQAAVVAQVPRMLLAGGLGADNVADAVRTVRPWGVDASSALERSPGRNDAAKMAAFVRAAKAGQHSRTDD